MPSRTAVRLLAPYFLLLAVFLLPAGCATIEVEPPLPEQITLTKLARCEPNAPIAWYPVGGKIATAADGLALVTLDTKQKVKAAEESPIALAWSPNGRRLAAGFVRNGDTLLKLYADAGGSLLEIRDKSGEPIAIKAKGRVKQIFWLSNDLILAASAQVKQPPYGVKFQTRLHYWDTGGEMITKPLRSAMLTPKDAPEIEDVLYGTFHIALSPYKDEILFTELISPPLGASYLKLVLQHLETGQARDVAKLHPTSQGGIFAGNGEEILYGDGEFAFHTKNPWTGELLLSIAAPGRSLAVSPDGSYLFMDNTLYQDGLVLAAFPAGSRVVFSPFGEALILQHGNMLYHLSGLGLAPPVLPGEKIRRSLLPLRTLRAKGIISPEDYYARKKDIIRKP